MTHEMTEERLAERIEIYRTLKFSSRAGAAAAVRYAAEDLANVSADNRRLRAENERLTAALGRKSDHAADLRIKLQFFIDRESGRIPKETAWPEWFSKNYPNRALNPEPTS